MRGKNEHHMWGMGLTVEDETRIRKAAEMIPGKRFVLRTFPVGTVPDAKAMDADEPCIVWMSKHAWDAVQASSASARHLDIIPRVLLLGGSYTLSELESALESGFSDVIKPPLTELRVRSVLMRTVETQHLYHDIMRMTREICLERELLERKNEMLSFIAAFLAHATESLEPLEIFTRAQEDLTMLLPVAALSAICWSPGTEQGMEDATHALDASLYISAMPGLATYDTLHTLLVGSAERLTGKTVISRQTDYLAPTLPLADAAPEAGRVAVLPLQIAGETIGAVSLLANEDLQLGRDQIQLLKSAMQHLALAIRNAMLYHEVKQHADLDGLTLVHNRRHFAKRLREEMDRHQRYDTPLALMMLDIDLFKDINDNYGHLAGDAVLKELAALLRGTLRSTDYVARYGGEEFVILLPHTTLEQAGRLAERLRDTVACYAFMTDNARMPVTVSIGVAALEGQTAPESSGSATSADLSGPAQMFVSEADMALYTAKTMGRNTVRLAPATPPLRAVGVH